MYASAPATVGRAFPIYFAISGASAAIVNKAARIPQGDCGIALRYRSRAHQRLRVSSCRRPGIRRGPGAALGKNGQRLKVTAREEGIAMATDTTSAFQWADPLLLDAQLTDDERMIAKTARRLRAGEAWPPHCGSLPAGKNRPRDFQRDGRAWAAWHDRSGGVRRSGCWLRGLWPYRAGDRAGRTPATAR